LSNRTLALEVTPDCPRDCLYCYNPWRDAPGPAPEPASPEKLAAVVDAALGDGRFVRADISGGEPLTRPDCFDLLDRILGHGVRPLLITDGGLVGPAEAAALARREPALVQLTVLSTDRAVHARLKGAPETALDTTLHAAALLARAGVRVSVAFVCTRLNHDHLEDVVRVAAALGATGLAFSRLCTAGRALAHREELWPEPWMVADALARLPELGRRYGVSTNSVVAVPHCTWPGGGRCSVLAGAPNWTVDGRGRVRPCSVWPEPLGDLLAEGWDGLETRLHEELLPAERAALPAVCRTCDRLAACGGGCRASARASADGLDPLASLP